MSSFRMFDFAGRSWPVSLAGPYAILYEKEVGEGQYEQIVEYFVDWRKGIAYWSSNEGLFGERYRLYAVVRTQDFHVIAQHEDPDGENFVFSWLEAALDHFEPNIPAIKEKRRWEK